MEATVKLTEHEIKELKDKWVHQQLNNEYGHLGRDIKDEIKKELLEEVRKKDSWNRDFYLTGEFKKELHKCLDEEVGKLVEKELSEMKKSLRNIVREYLHEKIQSEVQDLLKKFMVIMPEEDLYEEPQS